MVLVCVVISRNWKFMDFILQNHAQIDVWLLS